MKRVLALMAAICVLAISGCSTGGGNSSGQTADAGSGGGVNVQEKEDNIVEISIPLSLMMEEPAPELSQQEKDNGFLTKEVTDEAIKYTIKKSKYDAFIKELQKTTADSIHEVLTDGTYQSIQEVKHTDDFGEITILVDKATYDNNFAEKLMPLGPGLAGCMYQAFALNTEIKCIVIIQDKDSGAEITRVIYPDVLNASSK